MDNTTETALPSYDNEGGAPVYEDAPSYDTGSRLQVLSTGPTLVLDPTGLFFKHLRSSDADPIYTLSASLLHVKTGSSIHVKRSAPNAGDNSSVDVYAIGDRYIQPLESRKPLLQHITVLRSSGLFAMVHLREIVWDFSTFVVPEKPANAKQSYPPTADGFLIGLITDSSAVQKHLLRYYHGKWVDEDDEVLALVREGGAECSGMPVLSVTKHLDQETMDFLVSAWCVTLWGDLAKRSRHVK